ncbi:MAG: tRNA lysidine(34) synthetase TilS [Bacteroidota bacterium]
MVSQVRRTIQSHALLSEVEPVLIGVSGGVDSMVLLHVMQSLGYPVQVAHVNYRMRGEASDADEALVVSYCDKIEVPCAIYRVEEDFHVQAAGASFQEVARAARYRFFEKVAREAGLNHVAVAHHQEDQAETVLLNLMRGSGAEGLAGMPYARRLNPASEVHLIRPLLDVSRNMITAYAVAHNITWREDASNASQKYLRNKVRHTLLPAIEKVFGESAVQNMATSAGLLQGTVDHALHPMLAHKFAQHAQPANALDLPGLAAEPAFWQTRLVMEACRQWFNGLSIGRQHAEAICQLLDAQVGRKVAVATIVVWRERDQLVFLQPETGDGDADLYLVDAGVSVTYPAGQLETEILTADNVPKITGESEQFYADAASLVLPLQLRRWEAGDKFVPFGMQGQKKVSDLLTDLKVPSHTRDNVWVLVSGDDIVWVVGYRAAEPVRVGPATKQVLSCTWHRR